MASCRPKLHLLLLLLGAEGKERKKNLSCRHVLPFSRFIADPTTNWADRIKGFVTGIPRDDFQTRKIKILYFPTHKRCDVFCKLPVILNFLSINKKINKQINTWRDPLAHLLAHSPDPRSFSFIFFAILSICLGSIYTVRKIAKVKQQLYA